MGCILVLALAGCVANGSIGGKVTGQQVAVLRPPQDAGDEGKLYAVAMSPDRITVAVEGWSQDNDIYLFDRASARLQRRISDLPNVILHLAYSPDGRAIAVGFDDSTGVQVPDGERLTEIARPDDTTGVDNGELSKVAWRADGGYLLAGGRWGVDGKRPVRRWAVGDWTHYRDLPLANNTLMDFAPCSTAACSSPPPIPPGACWDGNVLRGQVLWSDRNSARLAIRWTCHEMLSRSALSTSKLTRSRDWSSLAANR